MDILTRRANMVHGKDFHTNRCEDYNSAIKKIISEPFAGPIHTSNTWSVLPNLTVNIGIFFLNRDYEN